ncbi:LysR family transcriptional regulator [Winslowiella iniecta]|uniref:LysR family transcriptional regulator n=1 Tax=Winslowiella iniecta TaxID=1560201 RepID=A0A0L7TFU2_9GAMM|nr:LysR family transcriptional regulator [Winslowiella iniecta]KOC88189.1 LysR family transcriptional regulator [Winslowiella iniecta]KOC94213.1 LysR family transcriptional regulator [Winslowiella iniecta]
MNKNLSSSGDRISLLHTFVRIVESGSLSAAAMQMTTSQPTISRRLQTLEQLLGVKLIQRTTHTMKLTDDGERCYRHAQQLIENWQSMEDDISVVRDEPVGILRVRAPHAFGQDQLIGPLGDYLRRYPQTSVEWTLNDHSPDFIVEGIDCAIHVGPVSDPAVVAVLLAEVPRIVVASPALLAQFPAMTEVADLAQLPWLALNSFYRNEVTLNHIDNNQAYHFAIAPRISTDSLYAVRKAALNGLGAAMVSAWLVKEDLAQGELQQLLPQWQAAPLPIYLLYPYASYYPARLRKFLELMKEVMPGITGTRQPEARSVPRQQKTAK